MPIEAAPLPEIYEYSQEPTAEVLLEPEEEATPAQKEAKEETLPKHIVDSSISRIVDRYADVVGFDPTVDLSSIPVTAMSIDAMITRIIVHFIEIGDLNPKILEETDPQMRDLHDFFKTHTDWPYSTNAKLRAEIETQIRHNGGCNTGEEIFINRRLLNEPDELQVIVATHEFIHSLGGFRQEEILPTKIHRADEAATSLLEIAARPELRAATAQDIVRKLLLQQIEHPFYHDDVLFLATLLGQYEHHHPGQSGIDYLAEIYCDKELQPGQRYYLLRWKLEQGQDTHPEIGDLLNELFPS